MAEVATLQFKADTSDLERAEKTLDRLSNTGVKTSSSVNQLDRALEKLQSDAARSAATVGMTKDEIKLFDLATKGATKSQLESASATLRQTENLRALSTTTNLAKTAANDATGGMNRFRHTAGQLGYQVQDVAVQLQMGTNAFRVLGQQGSQIASAFGPTGAVYGAIIAVGSALVSALIPSLMNSKDAMKEMDEASEKLNDVLDKKLGGTINVLSDDFIELAKYQREAAQIQLFAAQIAAAEALRASLANINDQSDAIQQSWFGYLFQTGGGLDAIIKNTGLTGDQIRDLRSQIDGLEAGGVPAVEKLRDTIIDLSGSSANLTDEGRKIVAEIGNAANAYINASNTADDLKGSLDELVASSQAFNEEQTKTTERAKEVESALKAQANAQERINQQAMSIAASLQSEEQQIRESYARQRQIVAENTAITGFARQELMKSLNEAELKAVAEYQTKQQEQQDRANEQWLRGVIQTARRGYDERRNIEAQEIAARAQQTNQLLAFEDLLLKNKSETTKASAAIAINLLNAERRDNARKIVSDSYAAAMSAYKSLAGIPIIGPALGAAAAATVLGAGVSYAAKSLSGRALGGQVRAGESYVVGERGPEILTMGSSGRISPNETIKTPTPIVNKNANVTFQIVANDTMGFDRLLHSRRGAIISIINDALNDQGRPAIV